MVRRTDLSPLQAIIDLADGYVSPAHPGEPQPVGALAAGLLQPE